MRYGIDYENQELEKKPELLKQLANVDEDNVRLMYREEKLPAAIVTAGEYNQMPAAFLIVVRDIQNVQNGIRFIIVIAWTSGDHSDIQWYQLGENPDRIHGIYLSTVTFVTTGVGMLQIQVYLIDVMEMEHTIISEKYIGETVSAINVE